MHSGLRLGCYLLAFYGPQGDERDRGEGEPSFRVANGRSAIQTAASRLLSFSYCYELYVQCSYLDVSFVFFLVLGKQDIPIPLKASCRKSCHTVLTEYSSLLNQAGALAN